MIRFPIPSVVVLVGPANAGKTTWAKANFEPGQIVSSDDLRSRVGESEADQRASEDAFAVLDLIVERRLRRQLTTVIDTTGLDVASREAYREAAAANGLPCYAVIFDLPRKELEARNRQRERPIPQKVLTGQFKKWLEVQDTLAEEGFTDVLAAEPVVLVPGDQLTSPQLAERQAEDPVDLRFDLLIGNFTWSGGLRQLGGRLAEIAHIAEQAGFRGIWVMDHFIQIPHSGREWDEMMESYTTSGFLAAHTHAARVGVLVTGVTYRNPALVAKMVATLDVLSGGRAVCGLGAAWFEREHRAYGWDFPPVSERMDLLEDSLQLLPLMWGPGSPSFEGKKISVPDAICYPRPVQEKIPIVVGGSGERRTLHLVAQYADGCNLRGGPEKVAHKLAVLEKHCADVGRELAEIEVTHLSRAVVAADRTALHRKVESLKQPGRAAEKVIPALNAGTTEDHIGRFRGLAEAGVHTAIVSFPDVGDIETLWEFAPVIGAFDNG